MEFYTKEEVMGLLGIDEQALKTLNRWGIMLPTADGLYSEVAIMVGQHRVLRGYLKYQNDPQTRKAKKTLQEASKKWKVRE